MNRNELLTSTRAEFLRSFVEAIEFSLPLCLEGLFKKADRSKTSIAQRVYLDARGLLQNQFADVRLHMQKSMDKMLNRSFQTTYSNYRPSFPSSLTDGAVSLVDTSAFEDELRFNEITERFRDEAGEQLRDLNIRIALLFEQENIKERENPFRPYLFSRSIAMAVDNLGASAAVNAALTEQLAENLTGFIPKIYGVVNAHLAQHGIAAQLLLKPKRTPARRAARKSADTGLEQEHMSHDHEHSSEGFVGEQQTPPARNSSQRLHQYHSDKQELSVETQKSPIERLFRTVKVFASQSRRAGESSGMAAGDGNIAAAGELSQGGGPGAMSTGGTDGGAFSRGTMQGGGYAGSGSPGAAGVGGNIGGAFSDGTMKGRGYTGSGSPGAAGAGGNVGGAFSDGTMQGGGNTGNRSPGTAGMGGNATGGSSGGTQGGGNSGGAFPGGTTDGSSPTGTAGNTTAQDGQYGVPQPSGESRPEENVSARAGWLSGKKIVGDVLRRFFSGNSAPDDFSDHFETQTDGEPDNARPAIGQLAGSVQNLLKQNTPQTEEMFNSEGQVRNLIMEQRASLNEIAHDAKEQMTIDIVAMLFEFILRDTQVPAEVRAQLGRLQFLVLKVALRDNSLLTQKTHPARMLVNRIGSISLGLKQIDPSGANVTVEICRIVAELLADETENPRLFSQMLDDLDAFIAHELLANDDKVSRAVEAAGLAETRTLRLSHVTAQTKEALTGLAINEHLKKFFENDWARAIELADRTDPALAGKYRQFVPDLLWSILPKTNEEERQQLLALLPTLLKTVNEGMNAVGWNAAGKQTLMDLLFDNHTTVLRSGNSSLPAASRASIEKRFKRFIENAETSASTAAASETPENRKLFLEEAMQELDVRIKLLDTLFAQDADLQEDIFINDENPSSELSIAERLRIGVPIEVNLGGQSGIGRLNWIDPNATNLVLTLNDQDEPSMISVRMFQRLLNNDRVRFLESEPIFDRAIESLLISASQVH